MHHLRNAVEKQNSSACVAPMRSATTEPRATGHSLHELAIYCDSAREVPTFRLQCCRLSTLSLSDLRRSRFAIRGGLSQRGHKKRSQAESIGLKPAIHSLDASEQAEHNRHYEKERPLQIESHVMF